MTYGEALRLVHVLVTDPSTRTAASLAGWDHPASRELLALMDLYDLTHYIAWAQGGSKGQKPKPYPRPWPDRKTVRTKPTVTQEQIIAALREAGHTAPLPTR